MFPRAIDSFYTPTYAHTNMAQGSSRLNDTTRYYDASSFQEIIKKKRREEKRERQKKQIKKSNKVKSDTKKQDRP